MNTLTVGNRAFIRVVMRTIQDVSVELALELYNNSKSLGCLANYSHRNDVSEQAEYRLLFTVCDIVLIINDKDDVLMLCDILEQIEYWGRLKIDSDDLDNLFAEYSVYSDELLTLDGFHSYILAHFEHYNREDVDLFEINSFDNYDQLVAFKGEDDLNF